MQKFILKFVDGNEIVLNVEEFVPPSGNYEIIEYTDEDGNIKLMADKDSFVWDDLTLNHIDISEDTINILKEYGSVGTFFDGSCVYEGHFTEYSFEFSECRIVSINEDHQLCINFKHAIQKELM